MMKIGRVSVWRGDFAALSECRERLELADFAG
jgi:hypothetical protein